MLLMNGVVKVSKTKSEILITTYCI